MAQQRQIGSHKTVIFTDENNLTHVVYHSTKVVSFNAQYIILKTGGYQTNTTKTRMNQASNQFNLGYSVYQKKFNWFVKFGEYTYSFKNGVCIIDRKFPKTEQLNSIELH